MSTGESMLDSISFRGEGNQNFVVADTEAKLVYRLPKTKAGNCSKEQGDYASSNESVKACADFHQHVMKKLLGEQLVCSLEPVNVSKALIEHVNTQFQQQREAFRLCKAVEFSDIALRMPDLCFLPSDIRMKLGDDAKDPTFSFEIKPKSGVRAVYKSSRGDLVCQYCLHQHLYVRNGKYKRKSKYCPVELFSGQRDRMKDALLGLLETPQNNLSIFRDDCKIYDRHHCFDELRSSVLVELFGAHNPGESLSSLADLLIQALLSVPDNKSNVSLNRGDTTLPPGCVLHRLLQLQMMSSNSASEVARLYSTLTRHLESNPTDRIRYGVVSDHYDSSFLTNMEEFSQCRDDSVDFAASQVMRYKIAKSARDCSIMITLRATCNGSSDLPTLTSQGGKRFAFKVTLFDLDPKPFSKLPEYIELEKTLTELGNNDIDS